MNIREFSEHDIDEITSLMKNLCSMKMQEFDEDRWRANLEKSMKRDSNVGVLIAFDNDTNLVIGMAQCSVKNSDNGNRFGYISNLIVKEEQRRSGIGEKLMHHIVDYFKKNHIQSIRLALKTDLDRAAQLLFKKLGFQEIFRVFELDI